MFVLSIFHRLMAFIPVIRSVVLDVLPSILEMFLKPLGMELSVPLKPADAPSPVRSTCLGEAYALRSRSFIPP